jgi:hypothetical protein
MSTENIREIFRGVFCEQKLKRKRRVEIRILLSVEGQGPRKVGMHK